MKCFLKNVNFGIRGITHDWFENDLSDRQQCVEVGGKVSERVSITMGIQQSSILGPLLYIIYDNDIDNNSCAVIILFFYLRTQHCMRQIQILANCKKMLMCKCLCFISMVLL